MSKFWCILTDFRTRGGGGAFSVTLAKSRLIWLATLSSSKFLILSKIYVRFC